MHSTTNNLPSPVTWNTSTNNTGQLLLSNTVHQGNRPCNQSNTDNSEDSKQPERPAHVLLLTSRTAPIDQSLSCPLVVTCSVFECLIRNWAAASVTCVFPLWITALLVALSMTWAFVCSLVAGVKGWVTCRWDTYNRFGRVGCCKGDSFRFVLGRIAGVWDGLFELSALDGCARHVIYAISRLGVGCTWDQDDNNTWHAQCGSWEDSALDCSDHLLRGVGILATVLACMFMIFQVLYHIP